MSEKEEFRYIVRILNRDLNGALPVFKAIQGIKGVGPRMGKNMAIAFQKETGVAFDMRLGELSEEMDKKLEEIVMHPQQHAIPVWSLNRRRDFETGDTHHLVMSELDLSLRKDLQRLNQIKSYRGLRHSWGLTVRGQKTKSTHRGKGGVIGVMKKDAKAAAASSAAKPAK